MTTPLDAYWMPFTANRQFKSAPRLVSKAEGMHFTTPEGRQVLDGVAGLWCVNAGHARPRIVQAIQQQAQAFAYHHDEQQRDAAIQVAAQRGLGDHMADRLVYGIPSVFQELVIDAPIVQA